ncbi:MAG: DJ-1 family glyoxalase III [Lachnospiraceae bacterium]|nr:DJ-1 family glyoxalase III [Lachnospiraceae bacterium]
MKVFVFLADGFEEIEGLTVVDLLRRAQIETITVSINDTKQVVGSHKIPVIADVIFDEIKEEKADMVVLPGGMPGTLNLKEHKGVESMILSNYHEDRYIAAICAAPSVFAELGLLDGKTATSYPSFEEALGKSNYVYDKVAVDGKIITSRGLGTAIEFAGKMIEILKDKKTADNVLESIVH